MQPAPVTSGPGGQVELRGSGVVGSQLAAGSSEVDRGTRGGEGGRAGGYRNNDAVDPGGEWGETVWVPF